MVIRLLRTLTKTSHFYNNNTSLKDALAAFYFTLAHQFGKLYTNIGVRGEYLILTISRTIIISTNHDIQLLSIIKYGIYIQSKYSFQFRICQ